MQNIVDYESAAVIRAVKRTLDERNIPAFNEWAERFYGYGGAFLREAKKAMHPVVQAFMELAQVDALSALGNRQLTVPRGEAFVKRYVYNYALRHASSSKRQLLKLVRDAGKPKMGKIKTEQVNLRLLAPQVTDLPETAVVQRINEWKLKRARTVATDESIRQSNAAARETWRGSGVTKLMWRAIGKSCPFCMQLDGKVVGIREPFMEDGEVLTAKFEKKD